VDRAALPDYQRRLAVVSTKLLAGRTVVRVYSDAAPEDGFERSEPSLEDVYFAAMHVTGHPERSDGSAVAPADSPLRSQWGSG
jgi:ABC-2 type transport system ATP-binding protein